MAKALFSPAMGELRGRSGTVVFQKGRHGFVLRAYSRPRPVISPTQAAVKVGFKRASAAFKALTSGQKPLWSEYALSITHYDSVDGEPYHPTTYNAFMELALKFVQINPTGIVPVTPPVVPFGGDTVVVTAASGSGSIIFDATGPNAAGVRTELLVQKLASDDRAPQLRDYRSKEFVAFTSGSLSAEIPATQGSYAPAYRFVKAATGEATPLIPLPVIVVV